MAIDPNRPLNTFNTPGAHTEGVRLGGAVTAENKGSTRTDTATSTEVAGGNTAKKLGDPSGAAPTGLPADFNVVMSKIGLAGGVIDVAVLALMIAKEQSKMGSQDRLLALEANVKTMEAAAVKLEEAAELRWNAALATNIATIVGSAVTVGMTASALKSSIDPAPAADPAQAAASNRAANRLGVRLPDNAGGLPAPQAGSVQTAVLQAKSTIASSVGGAISAGGKILGDYETKQADLLQAESKRLDGVSARMEKEYAMANEQRESAKDLKQAALDLIRAKAQSEAEAERNAARNL